MKLVKFPEICALHMPALIAFFILRTRNELRLLPAKDRSPVAASFEMLSRTIDIWLCCHVILLLDVAVTPSAGSHGRGMYAYSRSHAGADLVEIHFGSYWRPGFGNCQLPDSELGTVLRATSSPRNKVQNLEASYDEFACERFYTGYRQIYACHDRDLCFCAYLMLL